MLFGWLEKLGLNKPVQIPPSGNYPWHESLIICQSPNSCSRTRLEGGNVKNLTRERLVKVGRRQFNPPCREIRESLTRVDPTCKGYPVKKGTYAPQCSRVPFFFFVVGNAPTGHSLFPYSIFLPMERREKNQFVVENKEMRFGRQYLLHREMTYEFIIAENN